RRSIQSANLLIENHSFRRQLGTQELLECGACDANRRQFPILTKGLQHIAAAIEYLPSPDQPSGSACLIEQAESFENPNSVWSEQQPGSDLPKRLCSFPDDRCRSVPLQGNRQCQTANSGTCN